MANMTEAQLTERVLQAYGRTPDPRLREILAGLIRHLHAFAREVRLTEPEWFEGIRFLTRTGQKCDDKRQEFILLSDLLGFSSLVNMIGAGVPDGATETTVLGPFYVAHAPEYPNGASIVTGKSEGRPLVMRGHVRNREGDALAGAVVDVWQADAAGFYHVQNPDVPEFHLCGRFRTDASGYYEFKTVKPRYYPVPTDGPVGELIRAAGRHPYRPGHVHAIVSAAGYAPLVTHVFDADDPYLDSDAVFAVKDSLVRRFDCSTSPDDARRWGVEAPFYATEYDFVLTPATGAKVGNFNLSA